MRPRIIILLLLSAIEMMIGGSRANSISALPDTSPTAAATITGFPGRGDSRETSPTGGPGAAAVADYDRTDGGVRKLSMKKLPWDVYTLILGAGVKLLLFLPILAVLAGKAVSLSLTALLVTSMAFLYRAQLDLSAKRSDPNENMFTDGRYIVR